MSNTSKSNNLFQKTPSKAICDDQADKSPETKTQQPSASSNPHSDMSPKQLKSLNERRKLMDSTLQEHEKDRDFTPF